MFAYILKIFAFFALLTPCVASIESCDFLKKQLKRNHVLNKEETSAYCNLGCNFQPFNVCKETLTFEWDFAGFVDQLMKVELGKPIGFTETIRLNRAVYLGLLSHVIPIIFTMVPMIVGYRVSGPMCTAYMVFHILFSIIWLNDSFAPMVNNIVVALVCMFNVTKSKAVVDYLVTFVVLFIQVAVVVATENAVINLLFGVAVVGMLTAQMVNIVSSKDNSSKIFIIFYLCQIIMSFDLLNKVIDGMFYDVFALKAVRIVLAAALPQGEYATIVSNVLWQSKVFALSVVGIKAAPVFIGTLVSYTLVFLAFRIGLGVMALNHLKFGTGFKLLWWGLYVYMIDLSCPVFYIFGVITGHERVSSRRGWYCIAVGIMLVFEMFSAIDFVVARFVLMVFDKFVFRTGYGGVSRLLSVDIQHCSGKFPVDGALPFCSINELVELSKHVVALSAKVNGANAASMRKTGVGFFVGDDRGMSSLMTVSHVVEDVDSVDYHNGSVAGTVDINKHTVKNYGGVDPVTKVYTHDVGLGARISFLAISEIIEVVAIVMLTGQDAIGFISEYKFRDGELHCAVNLKSGDSGSPLIALMKDGSFRYVGAVSRGTFDTGTKNIISTVVKESHAGSPGYSGLYIDVKENIDITRVNNLDAIYQKMVEQSDYISGLKDKGEDAPDLSDSEDGGGENLTDTRKKAAEAGVEEENPEDEESKKKTKKKRVKSSRKDAAFRKRLTEFNMLVDITFVGRDEPLRKELRAAYASGKIIEFNRDRRFSYGLEKCAALASGKGFARFGIGYT